MLSAQTRDEVTAQAMTRLHKHGCTMKNILATDEAELASLLHPVGMYRKKAGYIKKATQILVDKFDSDVPGNLTDLMSLPGVGEKMALLTLQSAWGKIEGIAVDTHVHRISNRLGWFDKETKQPTQTRKKLEEIFPKDMWEELNHLLVGFGQQQCRPVKPLCATCLNKSICPVGKKSSDKVSPYFESESDD